LIKGGCEFGDLVVVCWREAGWVSELSGGSSMEVVDVGETHFGDGAEQGNLKSETD
jgi:hypothetical protein